MPWNHVKWHDCPFSRSQTCCVRIPAKDAHVLMVAPLEHQQAPQPASALCTITLQAPVPPRKDAHSYQRSPNPTQQFPATAWKGKQDHDSHPERDCRQHTWSCWSGQQLQPQIRWWGWDCHHKISFILQAWHLVQSSPNAEEKALHFMTFGLDPLPLM